MSNDKDYLNEELNKNKIDKEICDMELDKFKKEYIEKIKFEEGYHIKEFLKNENSSKLIKYKKPFKMKLKDFYNKLLKVFYNEY